MERKAFPVQIEWKKDGAEGEFSAIFSTLNVIDADKDVTLPGAFTDGQSVRISHWGHGWDDLPVGKGLIHANDQRAWVEGRFFTDTQAGKEHYLTVKNLGDLQQWSYGYEIGEAEPGQFDGQDVRFLKRLNVIEVSPVMLGAGVGTMTTSIKDAKPYPNEHACRLREPGDFQADSFRRVTREHEGKRYDVIMGRLKGEDTMSEQAYRYPIKVWSETQARAHCADHEGHFEAAAPKSGARHTGKEYEQIQQIHDLAVNLGAKCAPAEDSAGEEEGGGKDEAGDRKSSNHPSREILAARVAAELLNDNTYN